MGRIIGLVVNKPQPKETPAVEEKKTAPKKTTKK